MAAQLVRARSFIAKEAREVAAAARTAPARVLVGESLCFLLILSLGSLRPREPEELVPPEPLPVTILMALYAAALVPARRRWPRATLLASTLLMLAGSPFTMAAMMIVAFSVGRRTSGTTRLWSVVLCSVALDFALQLLNAVLLRDLTGPGEFVLGAAFNVVLVLLFPLTAGLLLGQRQPLVRLLRERNEYLERAQDLTAARARLEERAHIAGEMHDMLGHRLSLLSVHAGALELSAARDAPQVSEQAQLLRTTARTALNELREILSVLRSTTNEPPEELAESRGCREDIHKLVAESRAAGLDVALHWHGSDLAEADARTRNAVHRIVREALTNAHKHAPDASAVVEVTAYDPVRIRVVNGSSSRTHPGAGLRSGLAGLEERARMLGGRVESAPMRDGGFAVRAELPAHPSTADENREVDLLDRPPEPPLDAEVLTLPRVLGAGCLLLFLTLLMGAFLTITVFSVFAR